MSAHIPVKSLTQVTIPGKKGAINSKTTVTAAQKKKDSMQPSTELAAVFGVPPMPTIQRVKVR